MDGFPIDIWIAPAGTPIDNGGWTHIGQATSMQFDEPNGDPAEEERNNEQCI